ncbi:MULTISPECIES: DMT family transporter [unclassified Coleofasciculus]|uniref:DMT family transporter n=1 Tax=unclassified Coleofasciculus TaxID=2692782 RepID=UPI001881AC13|nr:MULTISPECIES: DMT family transporter [unclassified Coleofasciculus]MBE9126369.1 DMT family transporter [Coleofasciculus sp. LEGE 07081]MBE9150022.1 DMT family transporter [Coleofasciculus sp. LEGE 07092]
MPLHQTSGRWHLGLGLSLVTVFMWGILPLGLTVTLQVLDIYTLTWCRFLIAFGLLVLYLTARQQLPSLQQLRSASPKLLAIATVFLGLNYLLYLQGLDQTSPTNAQVLIQLAPVLLGLGALAVFKERYTLRQWSGLGILTVGLALFFHEQLKIVLTTPSTYLLGNCIIVLAAATWAVYALAQKQLLQKLPSTTIMLVIYGGCAISFTPIAAPQPILTLSPLHLSLLLFCGLNTLIAYGAFAEALEHWEASQVSAVLALTPLVTLSSVWIASRFVPTLIAPEHWTVLGLLGAVLVVCGSMAIAVGRKR